MMPEFSFVIPVFNGEKNLAETLESILLQEGSFEIIVVDNNSNDGTSDICQKFQSSIRYIHCEEQGRGLARNAGAHIARGEFLVFIDSDVVLSQDWLINVRKFLQANPVDAVATRIIPEGDNSVTDRYRLRFARFKGRGTYLSLHKPHGVRPVINTASAVFRKKVFEQLGGFYPLLKRDEDLEFSTRLFLAGYFIGGTTSAVSMVRFTERFKLLSYLKREFEVRVHSLMRETSPPCFLSSFFWECLKSGDIALIFFCILVTISGQAGRMYRSYFSSTANHFKEICKGWKISFNRCRFFLTFEFRGCNYFPDSDINFILIDNEIYALDKLFQTRAVLNGLSGTFFSLIRNSQISETEKENLLDTKVFHA